MKKKIFVLLFFWVTVDSYSQWETISWPINNPISIHFKDTVNGLVCGNGIKKTFDGGKSWQSPQQYNVIFNSSRLYSINNNILFAFRYKINKTVDFGESWADVTPEGYHNFLDMYFVNDTVGYVVGNNEIYKTIDQGNSWNDISYTREEVSDLRLVHFIDENNGWIRSSKSYVLITTNGGQNWEKKSDYLPIEKIYFFDHNIGYAITPKSRNKIMKTTNGGYDWEELNSPFLPFQGQLNSLFFLSEEIGYVAASINIDNYLYGRIYKTYDQCKSWEVVFATDISSKFGEIFFCNENYGWAISTFGILMTQHGGVTEVKGNSNLNDMRYFTLLHNYPNPFNPKTIIEYSISKNNFVNLSIYNSLGEFIEVLVNSFQSIGDYKIEFDANKLNSGVYYYRLKVGNNFSSSKKMLLIK